ncbi:DUF3492 domain-containing protein [Streptomyces sp. AA1529]|uniref:DUF3492 domain-containing protein n=1 Tax=Streptomyces sp. AA1529 TaxID=1203257 RepID=UPI003D720121
MRIALLTEGGYPYVRGESALWCDRLVRGLDGHEFAVYALSRSARQEWTGCREVPPNVARVRTAPLWGPEPAAAYAGVRRLTWGSYGRREKQRFRECFEVLAEAVCGADPDRPGSDGPGRGRPGADRSAAERSAAERPAAAGAPEGGISSARPPAPAQADRFAAGLYGLAELAAERGGLAAALRSESAVRILESACRAPGAMPAAHAAQVCDLLAVTDKLERALRPLSLDWYGQRGGEAGLSEADLCHAVGAGPAALPGLWAKRTFGVPLLITEYGVRLREHYLASAAGAVARGVVGAPVRALLASFQRRLAREAYAQAHLITPGNTHARRWQERCGADGARLRTVYPGMDPTPFDAVGEQAAHLPPPGGPRTTGAPTLVWVGTPGPAKDLDTLLYAFARVRETVPTARLRIVERADPRGTRPADRTPGASADADGVPAAGGADRPGGPREGAGELGAGGYRAHCRALAARLFPVAPPGVESAVAFEELGGAAAPTLADAYALGGVAVLSSAVEGFPVPLVEAMFCGRAAVSTDVGAAPEVIGGTGCLVPARDPRALADACVALLRDPARAARLGAAARARALELFTVRQNVEAFRGIYRELAQRPAEALRQPAAGDAGDAGDAEDAVPLARTPESHLMRGRAATGARLPGDPAADTAAGGPAVPGADGRRPAGRSGRRAAGARPAAGNSPHVPSWARPDRGPRESAGGPHPVERAAVGAEPGEGRTP